MRKRIAILSFLLLVIFIHDNLYAQYQIGIGLSSPNAFTITPQANIINHQAGNQYSPQAGLAGKSVMWMEYGDGGFTTYPTTSRVLRNYYINPSYGTSKTSLLVVNNLYDSSILTTSRFYTQPWGSITGIALAQGDNSDTQINSNNSGAPQTLLSGSGNDIALTTNVYDIVAKDTMCMAITYKLGDDQILADYNGENNKELYIAFLYRNDAFNPFSANQILKQSANNSHFLSSFRPHHNESIVASIPTGFTNSTIYNSIFSSTYNTGTYFNNYVFIKIGDKHTYEQNVFLSMFVKSVLASGGSTGLKVVLIQRAGTAPNSSFSKLAEYETAPMSYFKSHDPNYITQYPVCMNLPKIPRNFDYHIHYQNIGAGDANKVKVRVFLPQGIDLNKNNIQLDLNKCRYADNTVMDIQLTNYDKGQNMFELTIKRRNTTASDLLGTNNAFNAFVNPATMGDIFFTVKATTAKTPDILNAHAEIIFTDAAPPGTNDQPPIPTNIARSWYSKCSDTTYCSCAMPVDSTDIKPQPCINCGHCTKWVGICWWWWVLIVGAIITIYVMTRRRNNNDKV